MSILRYKAGRCLLQSILDDARMTQSELAEKMGVDKQQINRFARNGQKMHIESAYNISVILNCHIEDLYEWVETGDNE